MFVLNILLSCDDSLVLLVSGSSVPFQFCSFRTKIRRKRAGGRDPKDR